MDPDQIIKTRKADLKSDDEEIRRRHEEHYTNFKRWLLKKSGLASGTVDNILTAIRSFYKRNYYPLIEVEGVDRVPVRVVHVPTQEELGRMVKAVEDDTYRAMILAAAQSGISVGDLTQLTFNSTSPAYGTIAKQLTNHHGLGIIHVRLTRRKTNITYDTFFGKATFEALKTLNRTKGTIFPITPRHFERIVKKAAEDAGVEGSVTPHSLRKYFATRLKLTRINDPAWNDTLIEYWMGHAIPKVKAAYFIPPVEEQAKLYLQAEPRLAPIL